MREYSTIVRLYAVAALAAMAAGCAGGAGTTSVPAGGTSAQSIHSSTQSSPAFSQSELFGPDSHKVSVDPRKVVFTAANPGPFNVTVTGPSKTASISESDDCTNGSAVMATVTGAGNAWVATSGNTDGVCHALFTAYDANGKKLGNGNLKLTNKNAAASPDSTKVQVSPKKVVFDASNPGPDTITVTGPSKTASITESDNCTNPSNPSEVMATVTGSGSTWVASAGNTTGVCHAKFTARDANGKKLGNGELKITNKL